MLSIELLEIVGPALAAGLMIALTHAPLGIEVLRRGIIFIDLAIAQIAGLGLVAVGLYMKDAPWWMAQSVALACALLAGLFFRFIERKLPRQQEAVIGTSFILAASLALLLLADSPHGGEEVRHLLSGQVLFVTWPHVLAHAPVYAIILSLWFLMPRIRRSIWFYILFAMAITSSVQLVGVYVVFASLIIPALSSVRAARPATMPTWPPGRRSTSACGTILLIASTASAGAIVSLAADTDKTGIVIRERSTSRVPTLVRPFIN